MTLLWIALATLASEDLACITAGVLIAQNKIGWLEGILACTAGIFGGDMLLFFAGRVAASSPFIARQLARRIPVDKLQRATKWLSDKGLMVVLLSRFTPGLRLPTYVASGLLRTRAWSFAGYFLLASVLWTPILVAGTATIGATAIKQNGPGTFLAISAIVLALRASIKPETRRRITGWFKRNLRWEFLPGWITYLPAVPYIAFLAIKHRSLTLFTAANPGIPTGGFVGESKSAILYHLSNQAPEFVAEYWLTTTSAQAAAIMQENELDFPVVAKPDIGERGTGVAIIRSHTELEAYFAKPLASPTILQRYVPGVEFGVYYVRHPREVHGRITSVTEKRFPHVTGDGRSTIAQLILKDPRAVCLAPTYRRLSKRPVSETPAKGERVQLIEIGSHCRGAIFLNGARFHTPAMEQAIDRLAKAHPGFHLGRFDLRAPSIDHLQRGIFTVIELNGVSAEPAHIYDPAVSLKAAYQAMFAQWRAAFEIGAANRAQGHHPTPLRDLIQAIRTRNS